MDWTEKRGKAEGVRYEARTSKGGAVIVVQFFNGNWSWQIYGSLGRPGMLFQIDRFGGHPTPEGAKGEAESHLAALLKAFPERER